MAICTYAKGQGLKLAAGEDKKLGKVAANLSWELGVEIRKCRVPGAVFRDINRYHVDVLAKVFAGRIC